ARPPPRHPARGARAGADDPRARRRSGRQRAAVRGCCGPVRTSRRRGPLAPHAQGRDALPPRIRRRRHGDVTVAAPVAKQILINADPWETRVAVLEDSVLAELYLERGRDHGIAGNIYKGKVVRVLPGMQAAFVEVGFEKGAFLNVPSLVG